MKTKIPLDLFSSQSYGSADKNACEMTMDDRVVMLGRYLAAAAQQHSRATPTMQPFVVALTGSVASGKTTLSQHLQQLLQSYGLTTTLISLDCFLYDNKTLAEKNLSDKKGWPESYDDANLSASLSKLKAGNAVNLPFYSHKIYDIDAKKVELVQPAPIIILEGLNILPWLTPARKEQYGELISLCLYLEVDEEILEQWFLARFEYFFQHSFKDANSIYQRLFAQLTEEERHKQALYYWREINLVNKRENLDPYKHLAHWLIYKDKNHRLMNVKAGSTI